MYYKRTAQSGLPNGFTLVEVLVVLSITAVLLGIGLPAARAVIDSTRLRTISNDFLASLYVARSEAIKRRGRVVLCKSTDGIGCSGTGGWDQGWMVFHDANNNGKKDADEQVIQQTQSLPGGFRMTGNHLVERYISFTPTGTTRTVGGAFQAGTVTLCRSFSETEGREIVLNNVGRMRVNKIAASSCD